MIRGALILAIGFAMGYGKAVSDLEEIKDTAQKVKELYSRLVKEYDNPTPAVDVDYVDANDIHDTPIEKGVPHES